ncbi:inositol-phosphate transport system substrate-binding protein [Paenibacillus endophyticus]|uniref:Inositol-phosphate transport system substrate-binding protein n=1 Tax=Paenibacillus endophyticus TaxID=1294268 RepID=A0A7W5C7E1_9BACL|nr:ABC transporter substrate-binding protein [Paenibacillus endophyticus]MBB3152503.1 inositol-phosphate transport system substrate-binding protein [Paenibacillus endophyticus]
MKKLALGLISVMTSMTLLAGCSTGSNSGAAANSSAESSGNGEKMKEVVISVRENTWGARKDNFIEAEKRANEELKSENVQIKIDWWPGIGDDELILQAQANKVADVFINSSVDIGWQLNAGLIRDVDWVGASDVFKNMPESYNNMMKYEDHYYGVIQDMDASPVFISRKALEGMGWTAAQIDELKARVDAGSFTFGELVDLADESVKKKLVKVGFGVEDTRFEGWNYTFDNFNYSAEENKMVLSKNTQKVYEFWQDAKQRGVVTEGIGEIDTDKAAELFIKGELFAEFARTEFYQVMRTQLGMDEDLAGYEAWFKENAIWIPVPSVEQGGKPVSYSNPALIYVGAKVDDEKMPYVQKLIEHVLDPDLQINHTLKSGKLPVTAAAQEDPRFQEMSFYKDHAYLIDFTKTRPAQMDYAVYMKSFTLGIDAILTKGQTAAEAFELFQKDVKQNVPADSLIVE